MDAQIWRASTRTGLTPSSRPTNQRDGTCQVDWCHAKAVFITLTDRGRILRGNLAPGGAVAKITGKEGLGFTGKARAFDNETDFVTAVETGAIKKGEKTVVVLRYLGPKGGPGELRAGLRIFFLLTQRWKRHA
jgi:hypothetical protein